MDSNTLMQAMDNPSIDRVTEPLSKAVRGAYEAAGPAGQRAKNAVHGVWLGHPLHPKIRATCEARKIEPSTSPGRVEWWRGEDSNLRSR